MATVLFTQVLKKYNIAVDNLPGKTKRLIKEYQDLSANKKLTLEQTEKLQDLNELIVDLLADYYSDMLEEQKKKEQAEAKKKAETQSPVQENASSSKKVSFFGLFDL